MLFLDAQNTLMVWRKLNIYEDVLYGIFGNSKFFIDADDKTNLLLGIIGLLKLEPQNYPNIIPFNTVMQELLQTLIFLQEDREKKENFQEENTSMNDSAENLDRTFNEEEIFDQSDFNYVSSFDNLNEVLILKETLNQIEQNHPQHFYKLINEISS